MDIYDEYPTKILMLGVERLIKSIKENDQYKFVSKEDEELLKEYREFQCILVSSAIIFNLYNLDYKNATDKKQIQTVFIGKSESFLRKMISQQVKCKSIYLDKKKGEYLFKGNLESLTLFEVSILFETYLKEVKEALSTNSPKYFWKYDREEVSSRTGEIINGEYRYYQFILEILFPEEQIDYREMDYDGTIFGHKFELDLTKNEKFITELFITELNSIIKNN